MYRTCIDLSQAESQHRERRRAKQTSDAVRAYMAHVFILKNKTKTAKTTVMAGPTNIALPVRYM
ncbi:rCG29082 [Rattus norvegicus]|uniref:RCG29082 n=1 Tax=Rattus norvegicus TaxID=10116 RepID=A6HVH2_RAT|nr:rCG29082 [Rattus norvegicus]